MTTPFIIWYNIYVNERKVGKIMEHTKYYVVNSYADNGDDYEEIWLTDDELKGAEYLLTAMNVLGMADGIELMTEQEYKDCYGKGE